MSNYCHECRDKQQRIKELEDAMERSGINGLKRKVAELEAANEEMTGLYQDSADKRAHLIIELNKSEAKVEELEAANSDKSQLLASYLEQTKELEARIAELCPPPTPEFQASLDSIAEALTEQEIEQ